ncbi:MAG: hypothetical protein H0U08_12030 [Actinobacteria bacterium]|nr:hypothetical protein [Actinomycetota bacterium]
MRAAALRSTLGAATGTAALGAALRSTLGAAFLTTLRAAALAALFFLFGVHLVSFPSR